MKIILTEEQYNLLKTNELNEDQHVSFNSRVWSEKLSELIKKMNYRKSRITGEKYLELYSSFPVDYFYIDFDNTLPAAAYDEEKSGYKDGKYCVYFVIGRYVNESILDHELHHAYEDYMRQSQGKTKIKDSKETKKYFSSDVYDILLGKHGNLGIFSTLFYGLYMTSNVERNAYSENIYDINARNSKFGENVMSNLRYYANLKVNEQLTEKDLDNWFKLKELDIPILKTFKNPMEFIKWSTKKLNQRSQKIINRFNKIKYKSIKDKN